MRRLGKFRIDRSIEIIGLDIAEMGGLSADLFDRIIKDRNFSMSMGSPSAIRSSLEKIKVVNDSTMRDNMKSALSD